MEQHRERFDTLERLLSSIQDQLTEIAKQLNNNNNPSEQQLLRQLADRRQAALDRYRVEWELRGRPTPVSYPRRSSEDGEDEID